MKKHILHLGRISLALIIILFIAIGFFLYIFKIRDIISPVNLSENKEQQSEEQRNQLNRQEITKDLTKKINEISPVKPTLGGNWYVNRFWFAENSNENFYVEYEDGHILRRVLVRVEKVPATSIKDKQAGREYKLDYKIIGYFEPGENNWILKKGKDTIFNSNLDLYEYDDESDCWLKKN